VKTVKRGLDRSLARALVAIMGVLVLDVLWQVFTRFVLRDPSSYTEELARFLLIWIGLLGAAYVGGQRRHLAVDLLPGTLAGARRRGLERLIQVFALVFSLVLLVGGSRLVWVTLVLGQSSAALRVPLGYVYLVVPLSGLILAFYSVYHFVHPDEEAA